MTNPSAILADEPTGALHSGHAREVLALLREVVHAFGQTVVTVTHDPVAASHADSALFLVDGRIVGQLIRPTADAVAERIAHLGDEVARPSRAGVRGARRLTGRGIATLLLCAIAAASVTGIDRFTASWLTENAPMRAVLAKVATRFRFGEPGVTTAELAVSDALSLLGPALGQELQVVARDIVITPGLVTRRPRRKLGAATAVPRTRRQCGNGPARMVTR